MSVQFTIRGNDMHLGHTSYGLVVVQIAALIGCRKLIGISCRSIVVRDGSRKIVINEDRDGTPFFESNKGGFGRLKVPLDLPGSEKSELDATLSHHVQRLDIYSRFSHPHASWLTAKAMTKVLHSPQDLGSLVTLRS